MTDWQKEYRGDWEEVNRLKDELEDALSNLYDTIKYFTDIDKSFDKGTLRRRITDEWTVYDKRLNSTGGLGREEYKYYQGIMHGLSFALRCINDLDE